MKPTIIEGWTAQHEACRQEAAQHRLDAMYWKARAIKAERRAKLLQFAIGEMQKRHDALQEELNESVR